MDLYIYSDNKYFSKEYSYYQDDKTASERTNNIRGVVKVTHDSIFFYERERKASPSRYFIPSIENRFWIDNSDKTWQECTSSCEIKYSITDFLNIYK